MAQFAKHFTLIEARAMLPDMRRRFDEMRELVARVRQDQIETAQDRVRILRGNGHGPIISGSASPLVAEIQRHIDEIVGAGIQIKDLERGLIDFPHFLDGHKDHEVFLCYETSEEDIGFWHEIDQGFAARRPL